MTSNLSSRLDEVDRPLWRLLPYMASRRLVFGLVVLSGLLYYGVVVALPALSAYLLGSLLTGGTSQTEPLVAGIVVAVGIAGLAQWWQGIVGHDWAYRLLKELRLRIVDGIARATPGRLLGRRTGELAEIAKNDVSATEMFFAHTAGDYIGAIVASVGSLAFVITVSPPSALVMAIMMVLVGVIPAVLARKAGEQGRAVRAASGEVAAEAVDVVQGLRELALARRGRDYADRVIARTEALGEHHRRYARRTGFELVTTELLLGLGLVALVAVASGQVVTGGLEARWLPAVIVLGTSALAPIATVSATARTLGDVRAAAARVLAVVGYPAHVREPDSPVPMRTAVARVEFDQVRFAYPGGSDEVLRGATFRVNAGETVALVGRSGAGKTTCTHLLLRFWDVTGGSVRINGLDLRELSEEDLRHMVAVVPQDTFLFTGTIADAIRLGRPEAPDADVHEFARLAGAHDFINALPNGYDTPCGERGTALSGGQRQRVAIARALLTRAPVLILDEAVSSLDTDSEQAMHESLDRTRASRTTLVIAHRTSTIRRADRVILLDGGLVVATGTHDELILRSETYRQILATQQDDLAAETA